MSLPVLLSVSLSIILFFLFQFLFQFSLVPKSSSVVILGPGSLHKKYSILKKSPASRSNKSTEVSTVVRTNSTQTMLWYLLYLTLLVVVLYLNCLPWHFELNFSLMISLFIWYTSNYFKLPSLCCWMIWSNWIVKSYALICCTVVQVI